MKKARALKDFPAMTDNGSENKSLTVYSGLNGNIYFPNPSPTMPELNVAIVQYSEALAQSKNRDRKKLEEKNVLRERLEAVLSRIVDYVNYIADGNRTMLLSTGFTVSADTTTPAVFSGNINNLKVTQGANSGELDINFKPVAGRRVYIFCYGEKPIQNGYWKVEHSIHPGTTLSGLERGKEHNIRAGVVSPKGETFYATMVTIMVL